MPPADAITWTLRKVADFYRVKLADKKTDTARAAVASVEKAITRFLTGKNATTGTARAIISAYDSGLQLTGNPVTDWRIARARLHGSAQLEEVFSRARLLRLLQATDALDWGLNDIWDGQSSYPGAADIVGRILADELVAGRPAESHPVTLMNMYKSKGKEFDAVIIAEGRHQAKLLDPDWDAARITQRCRVLRVAITRARAIVVFIRPWNAAPLTP